MDKKNKIKEIFVWIVFIILALCVIKNIFINLTMRDKLVTPDDKPVIQKTNESPDL